MKKVFYIFMVLGLSACSAWAAQKPIVPQIKCSQVASGYYSTGQACLSPSYYRLYRVAERIARTNGLDNAQWRIEVPRDERAFNAQSEDGRTINISPRVADLFADNPSALAFIVAHEMAHSVLRHVYSMQRTRDKTVKDIDEISSAYYTTHSRARSSYRMYRNNAVITMSNSDTNENEDYVQEQVDNRVQDFLKVSRDQEHEADRVALAYMVKAGFSPSAAIAVMSKINQNSSGYEYLPTTHPSFKSRCFRLEKQLKSMKVAALKAQGTKRAAAVKPLKWEYSSDKKSLIINSRQNSSGNVNDQFKKLFGE